MAGIKTAGSWLANKIWWSKMSNNIGAEPFRLENCKKKNVWEKITSNRCLINFRTSYQFHSYYDSAQYNLLKLHIIWSYELKKHYWQNIAFYKVTSSYHLCVQYFSQFSFDWEMYIYIISSCFKTAADYVYISESNEDWEKYSTQRW